MVGGTAPLAPKVCFANVFTLPPAVLVYALSVIAVSQEQASAPHRRAGTISSVGCCIGDWHDRRVASFIMYFILLILHEGVTFFLEILKSAIITRESHRTVRTVDANPTIMLI
ncbi:MAG: hypothetical protein Ta2B_21310 [Termitinemataceae bacterium]|nr:MAG: hypothetical protein Ta2B_21310 [Termitinemataceae bacterium]